MTWALDRQLSRTALETPGAELDTKMRGHFDKSKLSEM